MHNAGNQSRPKSNEAVNSICADNDLTREVNLPEARAFCRTLARSHYENFTFGSWFLPRQLRQHIYNLYAFSRYADDLADEGNSPAENLRRLDDWQRQLLQCYQGKGQHPVFVALMETINTFAIPSQLFLDLLTAFRQDQTTTCYATFDELLDYCRHSANPVGRIYLYLFRQTDTRRFILSDTICTALQLTNFWQDLAVDWRKGRVYLPKEDLQSFGCGEKDLEQQSASADLRRLVQFEVDRTQQLFDQGKSLVALLPRQPRFEVRLFIRGGEAVLAAIRRQHYDVLTRRPVLHKWQKAKLIAKTWWQDRIQVNATG